MKKLFFVLSALFLVCGHLRAAQTNVTATITITNAPTGTNGESLTFQGLNYVWTNTSPITAQLWATNGTAGCTTNLFKQLLNDWGSGLRFSYANSNLITIKTYAGGFLTISNSAGWMTNLLVTNIVNTGNATSLTESNFNATTSITLAGDTRTAWPAAGGPTYTNTTDLPGVINGSGLGTNTTSMIATNDSRAVLLTNQASQFYGSLFGNATTATTATTALAAPDGHTVASLDQATNAAATKAYQATNALPTGAFTTVGNAAVGNTNTMKVFAATNADFAATATNRPDGTALNSLETSAHAALIYYPTSNPSSFINSNQALQVVQTFAGTGTVAVANSVNPTNWNAQAQAAGVVTNNSQPTINFKQGINVQSSTFGGTDFSINPNTGGNPANGVTTEGGLVKFHQQGNGYAFIDESGSWVAPPWGATWPATIGNNSGYNLSASGVERGVIRAYGQKQESLASSPAVGANYSSYSPNVGGSVSGAEDLPSDGTQMVPLMPDPPLIITTWIGDAVGVVGQTFVTNIVYHMSTNGFMAAMTNFNYNPIVHIDVNTSFWTNSRTAGGQLAVNTDYFPSGGKAFCDYMISNSWRIQGTLYADTIVTNQELVNSIGIVNGSGPLQPIMSLNNVRNDITNMFGLHFSGLRIADMGAYYGLTAYENQITHKVCAAILSPNGAPWYDRIHNPNIISSIFLAMVNGSETGANPVAFQEVNLIGSDAVAIPAKITSSFVTVGLMQDFRIAYTNTLPLTSKGHYLSDDSDSILMNPAWSTNQYQTTLSKIAMAVDGLLFSYNATNSTMNTNFLASVTNSIFWSTWQDKLQNHAIKIYDNGNTNTSGWYRPLQGGKVSVWFSNETNGIATNQAVTWTTMNLPTNVWYQATEAWSKVNLGYFINSLTNVPIPAQGCALVQLVPMYKYTAQDNPNFSSVLVTNAGSISYVYLHPHTGDNNYKGITYGDSGVSSIFNYANAVTIQGDTGGVKINNAAGSLNNLVIPDAGVVATSTALPNVVIDSGKTIYQSYNGGALTNLQSSSILTVTNNNFAGCTTQTNIFVYTVPSGVTNTYQVGGYINVTAVSVDVIQAKVIFTDENNTSQTVALMTSGVSTISFSPMVTSQVRCKGGTTITLQATLTTGAGSITYDTGGNIDLKQ